MPNSEHVHEQDVELDQTGFVPKGKGFVSEAYIGEGKPCIATLSKADEVLCELAGLSDKQTIYDGKDKRREYRFVTNGSAVVQILNPFSDEYWSASVVDVSKNGLRLHVPVNVMPGSLVKVRIEDGVAFGDAKYCSPAREGFFVGLEIQAYVSRYAALNP